MSKSLTPLLLHAHSNGPNPIKIAIVLEYLHLPYEVQLWEGGDDPEKGVKGTRFLKINENGRVPALEDPNTGVISWESGAIMDHLLRVYDTKNTLGPRGDTEQDRVDFDKWKYFLVTTLAPMSGQCNWFRLHHPVKNDDALVRYQTQTLRCYDVLEEQLKGTDGASVLPGGYCAVDFHFQPWIYLYHLAGLTLDKHPLIAKWLRTLNEVKQVKDAYQRIKDASEHQS